MSRRKDVVPACTNASAGRGRLAAAFRSETNPLSSTEITRNIAARTLRRAKATTITTRAISRNTVGPSTVQTRPRTRPNRGGRFRSRAGHRGLNLSMVSIHCHCARCRPTQHVEGKRRRGQANELTFPRCHGSTLRCPYGRVLRKLLRIGGLPDELRAEAEAEGIIIWPSTSRSPGDSADPCPARGRTPTSPSYVGSLVITPQRVLGTLSTVPKLAGRTIDQRWDAPRAGPSRPTSRIPGCTSR